MKRLLLPVLLALVSFPLFSQEFGLASYYSDTYQGKPTAYGETYDKNKLTAAHKRHPLGTMLRVTREDNGKSVVVRVNDKGPFLPGRIVELSKAAAERIGLINDGVTRVRVEVVRKEDAQTPAAAQPSPAQVDPPQATPPPAIATTSEPAPAAEQARTQAADPSPSRPAPRPSSQASDDSHFGLYRITAAKEQFVGYGVQVASMKDYLSVLRKVSDLEERFFDNIHLSVERGPGRPLYKVLLGPFATQDQASRYAKSMRDKYQINGFVVQPEAVTEPEVSSGQASYGIYKLATVREKLSGFGVQVASLTDYSNVLRQVKKLDRQYFDNIHLSVSPGGDKPVYKVVLGPFESKDQATRYVDNMKEKYNLQGFVVDLASLSSP